MHVLEQFLKLVAPLAPHLAEEVWELLGYSETIFNESWPTYDPEKAKEDQVTVAVQVNGKLRDTITVARDLPDAELSKIATESDKVRAFLDGKQILKTIVVPNRIVNLVVK